MTKLSALALAFAAAALAALGALGAAGSGGASTLADDEAPRPRVVLPTTHTTTGGSGHSGPKDTSWGG
ncbi:hypothetical protein [Streptomyces sp. NPDC048603]|uniref:hypothetical protein n=1 Tax=Streptomyces sp. NPDC048603 TaxID=3365577 RepID=UPI003714650B